MEGGESSGSVKQAKGKQTERSASSKTITNTDLWSMLHTCLASLEDAVEEVLKELKRRRTNKDDEDEDDDAEDDEDDSDKDEDSDDKDEDGGLYTMDDKSDGEGMLVVDEPGGGGVGKAKSRSASLVPNLGAAVPSTSAAGGEGEGDDEEEGEDYSDDEDLEDEDYDDEPEEIPRDAYPNDFWTFGQSLTVKGTHTSVPCHACRKHRMITYLGGILTVADDLLKNDGKKFIEMMEQLAERRMAREEDAKDHYSAAYSHSNGGSLAGVHNHAPPDDDEYDDDQDSVYRLHLLEAVGPNMNSISFTQRNSRFSLELPYAYVFLHESLRHLTFSCPHLVIAPWVMFADGWCQNLTSCNRQIAYFCSNV